jgi:hypothetical protein
VFRRIAITAITLLPLGAVAAPLPPTNSGGAPTLIVPPINAPSPAQVTDVRSSKGKTTRIVVDLSAPVAYEVMRYPGRITVRLPGTTTRSRYQSFGTDAVARMRLVAQDADTVIEVEVASRADVDVFLLHDPDRVVIDATLRDDPPPSPGPPTSGLTYERLLVPVNGSGNKPLHLVKLDPSRYAPRVITAGWGATRNVLDLAASEGAVAAINGGYFDPASSLAVDLVMSSSGVLAYALGNRPALLLSGPQAAFGIPRGRLVVRLNNLDGTTTAINVSTVNPNPRPGWVTAFIGDGFVPTGASGFTTLTVADGLVTGRHEEPFTPEKGVLTVSFQPTRWSAGEPRPCLDGPQLGCPHRSGGRRTDADQEWRLRDRRQERRLRHELQPLAPHPAVRPRADAGWHLRPRDARVRRSRGHGTSHASGRHP